MGLYGEKVGSDLYKSDSVKSIIRWLKNKVWLHTHALWTQSHAQWMQSHAQWLHHSDFRGIEAAGVCTLTVAACTCTVAAGARFVADAESKSDFRNL